MAHLNACSQCVKLDEAVQVLKKKVLRKNQLINLYKDLSNSIDLKKLKYSSEEVNKIYKTAINDAEVLRNRLSYFIEENSELSKAREDLRSQISELERKCQLAEDKHNHILFINKQLVDYHTSSEKEINQLKNRLKKLAKCLQKYEPSSSEVKATLCLPSERKPRNLSTTELGREKIIPSETAGSLMASEVSEKDENFDEIADESILSSDFSDTSSFTSFDEDLQDTQLKKSNKSVDFHIGKTKEGPERKENKEISNPENYLEKKESRQIQNKENLNTNRRFDTLVKDMSSNTGVFEDKCLSETETNCTRTSIFDLESTDFEDMNCSENSKSNNLSLIETEMSQPTKTSTSKELKYSSPNTKNLDSTINGHSEAVATFSKQLYLTHDNSSKNVDCFENSFVVSESEFSSINSEHNYDKPKNNYFQGENNSSTLSKQMENPSPTSVGDISMCISERQNFRLTKDSQKGRTNEITDTKSDSNSLNSGDKKKYNRESNLNGSLSKIPELLSPLKSIKSTTSSENDNLHFKNDKNCDHMNSTYQSKPMEIPFDSSIFNNPVSFNEDQSNEKNIESTVKRETFSSTQYSSEASKKEKAKEIFGKAHSEKIPLGSNTFSSQYHYSDQNYLYECCSCKESLYRDRANFLWSFNDNSSVQISVPIQIGNEKIGIEINDGNNISTDSRESDGLKSSPSKYSITVHLKPEKVTSDFNCHCSFNSGFGNRNYVKSNDYRFYNETTKMEKGKHFDKFRKISDNELWNEWRKKMVENSMTQSHSNGALFQRNTWSFLSPKVFPHVVSHFDIDELRKALHSLSMSASIKKDGVPSLHNDSDRSSTFSFTKKPTFYNPLSKQNSLSEDWVFGKSFIEHSDKHQSSFKLKTSILSQRGRGSNILENATNLSDQVSSSTDNHQMLHCKKYPTSSSDNEKAVVRENPFKIDFTKKNESSSKQLFEKQKLETASGDKGIFGCFLRTGQDKKCVKVPIQRLCSYKSNISVSSLSSHLEKKSVERGTIKPKENLFDLSKNNVQTQLDINNKQGGRCKPNTNNNLALPFSPRISNCFSNDSTNPSAEVDKSLENFGSTPNIEHKSNLRFIDYSQCSPQSKKNNTSSDSEQVGTSCLVSDIKKSLECSIINKSISPGPQYTPIKENSQLEVKKYKISPSKNSTSFNHVKTFSKVSQMQEAHHVTESLKNGHIQGCNSDLKVMTDISERNKKAFGRTQTKEEICKSRIEKIHKSKKEEEICKSKKEEICKSKKEEICKPKKEEICKPKKEEICKSKKEEIHKPKKEEICKSTNEEICKPKKEEIHKPKKEEICKSTNEEICKSKKEEICKSTNEEICKPKNEEICKSRKEEICKPKKEEICKSTNEEICKLKKEEICKSRKEEICKPKKEDICNSRKGEIRKHKKEEICKSTTPAASTPLNVPPLTVTNNGTTCMKELESSSQILCSKESENCATMIIKNTVSQCSIRMDTDLEKTLGDKYSDIFSNKQINECFEQADELIEFDEEVKQKNSNLDNSPFKDKNKSSTFKKPYLPEVRHIKKANKKLVKPDRNCAPTITLIDLCNENEKCDSEEHIVAAGKEESSIDSLLKMSESPLTLEQTKTDVGLMVDDSFSEVNMYPAKKRRIMHTPNHSTPSKKCSNVEKNINKTTVNSLSSGTTTNSAGNLFKKENERGAESVSLKNGFKVPKVKVLKKRFSGFGCKNDLFKECELLDQIFMSFEHTAPLSPLSPGDAISVRKNHEQLKADSKMEREVDSSVVPIDTLNTFKVLDKEESCNKKDLYVGSKRRFSENICENLNFFKESKQNNNEDTKIIEDGNSKTAVAPYSSLNEKLKEDSTLINCEYKTTFDLSGPDSQKKNNFPKTSFTIKRKVNNISHISNIKDSFLAHGADNIESVLKSSENKERTVHILRDDCLEHTTSEVSSLIRNNSHNIQENIVNLNEKENISVTPESSFKKYPDKITTENTDKGTDDNLSIDVTELVHKESSQKDNKNDLISASEINTLYSQNDCLISPFYKEYDAHNESEIRTSTKNENNLATRPFKDTNDEIISRCFKNIKVYPAKKKSSLIKANNNKTIDNNISTVITNNFKHEINGLLKSNHSTSLDLNLIQSNEEIASNDCGNECNFIPINESQKPMNNLRCDSDSPPFMGFDIENFAVDLNYSKKNHREDNVLLPNKTTEHDDQCLSVNCDKADPTVSSEQSPQYVQESDSGKRKMMNFCNMEESMPKKVKLDDEASSEEDALLGCMENLFLFSLKHYSSEVLSNGWKNDKKPVIDTKSISDIKYEILRLFGTSEDNLYQHLNKVVEPLINSPHIQPRPFAKAVIEILCQDNGKELEAYPKMSRAAKLCLLFTISYIGYNRHFLLETLKVFEEHLCAFYDRTLSVPDGVKLVTFYGALCRSYDLDNKGKQVLYDILYARHIKAYPMIYKLLKIWPTIVPKAEKCLTEGCLLTQTIVFILMSSRCNISGEKLQSLYQTNNFRTYLNKFYGYDYEFQRRDSLCDEILKRISEKGCRMALILLAQCEGYEWAISVVEKKLFPLLYDWLQHKSDYSTTQEVIISIGMIVRAFPLSKASYFVKTTLDLLEKVLHNSPDNKFSETVIEAVSLLRRHNLMLCALILIKWIPKSKTVTKKTLDHVRNILSVKNIIHWRSFYLKYHTYDEAQHLPS